MTFAQACAIESSSPTFKRGINGHLLAAHTRLKRVDDHTFVIRFHATDVVTIHDDGTYTLRNAGNWTATTAKRIEQYTPFTISHGEGREWFVSGSQIGFTNFRDGMRINAETGQRIG